MRHNKRITYFKNIYKAVMWLEKLEPNRTKVKKNKSLSIINLPVCREMVLSVALTKFILICISIRSEQFHSFIVPVQVATELNSYVGNEQWNRTRSIVIIRMNICFFLRYQYDYCSKLHSHLFMPMTLD